MAARDLFLYTLLCVLAYCTAHTGFRDSLTVFTTAGIAADVKDSALHLSTGEERGAVAHSSSSLQRNVPESCAALLNVNGDTYALKSIELFDGGGPALVNGTGVAEGGEWCVASGDACPVGTFLYVGVKKVQTSARDHSSSIQCVFTRL